MSDQATAVDPTEALVGLLGESVEEPKDEEQPEEGQAEASADEEQPEAGTEDEPQQVETIKVRIKGDDGNETEKDVTLDELKSGYMMQADYTRKTQALANAEKEIVQTYSKRLQEYQEQAVQTVSNARSLLTAAIGSRSQADMAMLAANDPAQYVQELHKQNALKEMLSSLDQETSQLQQKAAQERAQLIEQAKTKAWEDLSKAGVTRDGLAKIYSDAQKVLGVSSEELSNIYDARAVLIMRDALAFRQLQAQKPGVSKKVAEAAPMPKAKQSEPPQLRASRELRSKFTRDGGANLNDLAALLKMGR